MVSTAAKMMDAEDGFDFMAAPSFVLVLLQRGLPVGCGLLDTIVTVGL